MQVSRNRLQPSQPRSIVNRNSAVLDGTEEFTVSDGFQSGVPSSLRMARPALASVSPTTDGNEKRKDFEIEFSLAQLKKPLTNAQAKEILSKIDKNLSPASLLERLMERDPGADEDSRFLMRIEESDYSCHATLVSKRTLSQGRISSSLKLVRKKSAKGKQLVTDFQMRYRSDGIPSLSELPETLSKAWKQNFDHQPQQEIKNFQNHNGLDGELVSVELKHRAHNELGEEESYAEAVVTTRQSEYIETDCRIKSDGRHSIRVECDAESSELPSLEELPRPLVEAWEKWTDPSELVTKMLQPTGLKATSVGLSMSLDKGGNGAARVNLEFKHPEIERGQGSMSFSFRESRPKQGKSERIAYHSMVEMTPELQGQGISKRLLGQNFGLYLNMDIDKVELGANLSVGGYAWAKYGCQLEKGHDERLEAEIESRLWQFSESDQALVRKILAQDDPKKIWVLSDLAKPAQYKGRETTLGKALLLGTKWNGHFDLKDQESLQRLMRYANRG